MSLNDEIRRTLDELRESTEETVKRLHDQVARAVRDEQLRDQLSGLPNDAALTQHLEARLAENTPYWVAFVEVDHFKRLNSRFGYQTANALLHEIARQLRASEDGRVEGERGLRAHLEEAVAEAKRRGRDCVVRYTPELAKMSAIDLRADCGRCHTSFTCMIPKDAPQEFSLHCPNCGESVERPPPPAEAAPPPELPEALGEGD